MNKIKSQATKTIVTIEKGLLGLIAVLTIVATAQELVAIVDAKKVDFEISSLHIPNISSSKVRLNKQYSDLPESLVDIVKKNNLYLSN